MTLDDRYTIIFNGEIYNHKELKTQFGYQTTSQSDTETLLMLYRQFGERCLDYLDGMFSFAIYDNVEQQLFLARDRAGKKPLYIYKKDEAIVFASELNALRALLPLEMEQSNLYQYMRLGVLFGERTPYKNVTELRPGSFASIDCRHATISVKKWWNVHEHYLKTNNDDFETALEKTNDLLTAGVKRRIESSDLEVGCFLSGGIDSGLVTSIASGFSNKLKTLTVSFDGEYDESPLAQLVAEKYNTDHSVVKIAFDDLIHDVEGIIANYGEPFFDSSAIPSYYVSKAAKKQVTVILNGDGADELFAGYRRYVPFSKHDFFKKNALLRSGAAAVLPLLPKADDKKSKYNYIYRLAALASKTGLDVYFAAGADIMEGFEKELIHCDGLLLEDMQTAFDNINQSGLSGLKKLMNLDFDTNFAGQMLAKIDIATMQHSLEGRSPFLSRDILQYAPGLSDKYKINGVTTKYLLRKLAERYLPEPLIHQPKRGFEVPLKKWVNGLLKDMIHDYIGASGALNGAVINKLFTEKLLENKISMSAEKRAKILWTIFCMEVWYKKIYLQ